MKKIISLILAMAMCLSLCVQTFAKENDGVNVENVPGMMAKNIRSRECLCPWPR